MFVGAIVRPRRQLREQVRAHCQWKKLNGSSLAETFRIVLAARHEIIYVVNAITTFCH